MQRFLFHNTLPSLISYSLLPASLCSLQRQGPEIALNTGFLWSEAPVLRGWAVPHLGPLVSQRQQQGPETLMGRASAPFCLSASPEPLLICFLSPPVLQPAGKLRPCQAVAMPVRWFLPTRRPHHPPVRGSLQSQSLCGQAGFLWLGPHCTGAPELGATRAAAEAERGHRCLGSKRSHLPIHHGGIGRFHVPPCTRDIQRWSEPIHW